jgi:hypothetical protein
MNWLHLVQVGVTILLLIGGALWYDRTRALKK